MGISVSAEVSSLLQRSTIEGMILRLPAEELERALYVATDKVLTALGGRWDKRKGGHVFPFDPAPKIAEAVGGGSVVSRQQRLQHFDTPKALAEQLVATLNIQPGDRCLEPSAGRGRIVEAIARLSPAAIAAVEIDEDNGRALAAMDCIDNLFIKDFLDFNPAEGFFTVVAMNPPFKGNQDIKHVRRAFSMLAPGGRLAAIVSEHGFIGQERECAEWRQWLADEGASIEGIPAGAFKESGTGIRTRMILLQRDQQ